MAKKRIDILYIRMKYNKQPLDIPALLAMLKARGGGLLVMNKKQYDKKSRTAKRFGYNFVICEKKAVLRSVSQTVDLLNGKSSVLRNQFYRHVVGLHTTGVVSFVVFNTSGVTFCHALGMTLCHALGMTF